MSLDSLCHTVRSGVVNVFTSDNVCSVTPTSNAISTTSHQSRDGCFCLLYQLRASPETYCIARSTKSFAQSFSIHSCVAKSISDTQPSYRQSDPRPLPMSSIPHQFHDELIDHATLPLYNWDQALAENEARQAAADAEHFDRYQDRSASQYPTVAHHASHNGWAEPDDLTQPCHTTQYNDIRVHGGEDAYFDPSSKHAGHGSWIDSKFESGVQAGWYEQADPQHRQRPPQEYAARAVTLAGEHEPDRRVAVAAPEQASFAYQAGPAARHNRAYYQAQAHQNQNVSQRPLNEFLGPPTVSNRASPLPSSQRLAARPPPRTLPPQPGATRYQHVNASTTSRQSSVTRIHGPALTVTPLPDGPRIHHPSLIYTIEEEDEDDFFNVRPHIHRPSLRVAEETTNHNHNHNHNHRDNRVSSVGHAAQSGEQHPTHPMHQHHELP